MWIIYGSILAFGVGLVVVVATSEGDFLGFLGALSSLLGGIGLAFSALVLAVNAVNIEAELAKFEATRGASVSVVAGSDEGVLRMAAEANAGLAENKALHRSAWFGAFVRDEWMSVEPIDLSGKRVER